MLFLDRDGVINRLLPNDYVKIWEEFEFMPLIRESLERLKADFFDRIVIVTNQQGVGKKLMTEAKLHEIHEQMLAYLNEKTVLIDKIYYCTALTKENSPLRKPEIGMALQAQADFPDLDFSKSCIIGDSLSDMQFGRKAGVRTVLFGTHTHVGETEKPLIDYYLANWDSFSSLCQFLRYES